MKIIFIFFALASLQAAEYWVLDGRDFPKMGMFAAANQVLGGLSIYETKEPIEINGVAVNFDLLGLYYDPMRGANWWDYYFEPLSIGSEEGAKVVHPSREQSLLAFKKRRRLTRIQAAEIVQKYIRVKQSILDKVDSFAVRYLADFFVIGVHYRGTDKSSEAPRTPYSQVFQAILKCIPNDKSWLIFAATDEAQFLRAIQSAFPGKVIACETHRSETAAGIHFLRKEPYELGEEALIDALLLSRSNLLIRTSSNLSLWSTYFNPRLPVVLLSQNYRSKENREPE